MLSRQGAAALAGVAAPGWVQAAAKAWLPTAAPSRPRLPHPKPGLPMCSVRQRYMRALPARVHGGGWLCEGQQSTLPPGHPQTMPAPGLAASEQAGRGRRVASAAAGLTQLHCLAEGRLLLGAGRRQRRLQPDVARLQHRQL